MESLGEDCKELKRKYEACFNNWYSEYFLKNKKGDMAVCEPLFLEYQKCLKIAIKKNNIPLWELEKDSRNESDKKTQETGSST